MPPSARRRPLLRPSTAALGALLAASLAPAPPAHGQDVNVQTAPAPSGPPHEDAGSTAAPGLDADPPEVAPGPVATPAKPPPASDTRSRALWLQPLSVGFFGLYLDERGLLLPLGLNWPAGENLDLVAEASVGTGLPAVCGRSAVSAWGSLGVAFRSDGGPLNGGFFQPKALFRYSRSAEASCPADDGGLYAAESEASVGVDFGLQHTVGSFYVALVMGMHAGYCWNCPSRSLFSFGPLSVDPPRTSGIKVGFNPNFLRLGYAF